MQTFAAPGYMACPGNRKDVPRPILGAPGGLAGLGLAPSPSRAGPRVGAIYLWHPPPPVPPGFLGQAPGLMRPSPPANPLREAVFPAVGSSVVIPVFLGYQHPQLRFLHLHAETCPAELPEMGSGFPPHRGQQTPRRGAVRTAQEDEPRACLLPYGRGRGAGQGLSAALQRWWGRGGAGPGPVCLLPYGGAGRGGRQDGARAGARAGAGRAAPSVRASPTGMCKRSGATSTRWPGTWVKTSGWTLWPGPETSAWPGRSWRTSCPHSWRSCPTAPAPWPRPGLTPAAST